MRVPRPPGHGSRDLGRRRVEPARAKLGGHTREVGGEDEDFDAALSAPDCVGEMQEHARVALHRPADVAQQHHRTFAHAPVPARQFEDVTARAHAVRQCSSKVHPGPVAADPAARAAIARPPLQPLHRGASQRDLGRGVLREVLVCQRLRVTPCLQDARWGVGGLLRERHPGTLEMRLASGAKAVLPRVTFRPAGGRNREIALLAPERVERAVEYGEVFSTMDEQGAARVVHVLARTDVDMLQRLGDVEEAPDVHLHAERPQQPAEDEDICQEGSHDAPVSVWPRGRRGWRARRPSPRRCRPWT